MTLGIPIIDADSHLCEVPDLWSSRMSSAKWGDAIPHVAFDERIGLDRWYVGDTKLTTVAGWASAGWPEPPPAHPPSLEEADPAAFYAEPRLAKLDEYGIYAQVLYPNLLAFTHHAFTTVGPEFATACVRAYNDYLIDFASADPKRFILLASIPFWDIDAAVAELERCADSGHFRGALLIAKPQKMGLPEIYDEHWSGLFARADELGWSINFHTGFAEFSEDELRAIMGKKVDRRDTARQSACAYLNNGESIANVVMGGLCHRYPRINFVWVESAFGWMPSFVESMDWQWLNAGADLAYPDMDMPSSYFRRQVHGMFWFEGEALKRQVDLFPDNLMFETDFPHPTSLSPGPASPSEAPDLVAAKFIDGLPEDLARKILFGNAARVYGVEEPPEAWTAQWLS